MQKELDELRNLRKIKDEEKNRLTEELATLQEKLSKLQDSEGALVKLQSELEASKKRRLYLEKERGKLEEKLRLLERNVAERDEMAQKLKEQIKQYKEMRSNLEKERDSFGKERDEFKKEQDELTRKYEALQNENTEEKRKHAAEVARLRENLQSTMQEKDILAQKLKEESDVNQSNSINLKKEQDDLKEMIEMLENFKKIEEKEKKRLHEEINYLRGVLQTMKQDKESRDILHKNLLDEKEKRIEDLQSALKCMRMQVDCERNKYETTFLELQEGKNALEFKLSTLQNKFNGSKSCMDKMFLDAQIELKKQEGKNMMAISMVEITKKVAMDEKKVLQKQIVCLQDQINRLAREAQVHVPHEGIGAYSLARLATKDTQTNSD